MDMNMPLGTNLHRMNFKKFWSANKFNMADINQDVRHHNLDK